MSEINIFDFKFSNEELQNEFLNFFPKFDLMPLFTNEHRSNNISVTYLDARSVISNGKYARDLKDLSDILSLQTTNKSYEEAIFSIIYRASTFQKLMANIRKLNAEFAKTEDGKIGNFWNIVFYSNILN